MEKRYEFILTGRSPLIMHWDNIEWADQVNEKRTQIKERDKANFSAGDDRCPPDTWKGYLYNDGKRVTVPTDNLRTCLMKAGAKITLKKAETFKRVIPSGILFEDLDAEFLCGGRPVEMAAIEQITGKFTEHSQAVLKLGFRLLVKRAVVGASKHVRVRPLFTDWQARGTFVVIDDRIGDETVRRLWEIAGQRIGIGDWRPDAPKSPGPYGRYAAELKLTS